MKRLALLPLLLLAVSAFAQEAASNKELLDRIKTLEDKLNGLEKQAPPPSAPESSPDLEGPDKVPFGFADFTWLNGNSRETTNPLDTKYFTPQVMVDANMVYQNHQPSDHTLDGSCEVSRTNELQLQQLGVGGDLHVGHIRGRLMTQFGMYSQMTPRNDASTSRGQWNLADAYRYVSEANGGYHWNKWYGINLDAGIFMSYVGLFSYYNNENWAYQPSYVSANTPWFFNGLRLQIFPTEHLKIEPWLINGWQSYGMFNETPGLGAQILWRPTGSLSLLSNNYWGYDTPGNPSRQRYHTDDSVEVKYYDRPASFLDKGAFSVTMDLGCESGGGVSCGGGRLTPKQNFLGFMVYNRLWFAHDHYGLTVGGGAITNPGRYLVLLPPVNGATASSGEPSYFTANPGDSFKAWDASVTFDYMPNQWITWRAEFDYREANVPYFVGPGGITPPGGNQGAPGSFVPGFTPDLVKSESRINLAMLVRL